MRYQCHLLIVISMAMIFCFFNLGINTKADDGRAEIEKALYTTQEFFGSEAIVPIPTSAAKRNLEQILIVRHDDPIVLEKLANANEALFEFEQAEQQLKKLAEIDHQKNVELAAFYGRRARYDDQATVLETLFENSSGETKSYYLEQLLKLASLHQLQAYSSFKTRYDLAAKSPNDSKIYFTLINESRDSGRLEDAIEFTRIAKSKFPDQHYAFLMLEIDLLTELGRVKESTKIYKSSHDPFWSKDQIDNFFNFLERYDQLSLYGNELKERFKLHPDDVSNAIKYANFKDNDRESDNDNILDIVARVENAKSVWSADELVRLTRVLIRKNEGETASRFLYTLFLTDELKNKERRNPEILYQLFLMFVDAEQEKLAITKGDLDIYREIGKADDKPGLSSGILSLLLADTSPEQQIEERESQLTKYFNLAAAYRIFNEFKNENPEAPELSKMYSDLISLNTRSGNTTLAADLLTEMEAVQNQQPQYAHLAFKLALELRKANRHEKATALYVKLLNRLGRNNEKFVLRTDGQKLGNYRDNFAASEYTIDYKTVLNSYVEMESTKNNIESVLKTYSEEIKKYPEDQELHLLRLNWLEKTNLTADIEENYKVALAKFDNADWRDRLARFYLRHQKGSELNALYETIFADLNEEETRNMIDIQNALNNNNAELRISIYQNAIKKFPHNQKFVSGLLNIYQIKGDKDKWFALAAKYYFVFPAVRYEMIAGLAKNQELRIYLQNTSENNSEVYRLFKTDANIWLSKFEDASSDLKNLANEYQDRDDILLAAIDVERSIGQKLRTSLLTAKDLAVKMTEKDRSNSQRLVKSGEISAEVGDYLTAIQQWQKLPETELGKVNGYKESAAVSWDYFQYQNAKQDIRELRKLQNDQTYMAFELGAIHESENEELAAFKEYLLAAADIEDREHGHKAASRLSVFIDRGNYNAIDAIFKKLRRKNSSKFTFGYARSLKMSRRDQQAAKLLRDVINESFDNELLVEISRYCDDQDLKLCKLSAISRLSKTGDTERKRITSHFDLIDELNDNYAAISRVLTQVLNKYPLNYGVIVRASEKFAEIGEMSRSANVYKVSLPKSKGIYRYNLANRLAQRLIKNGDDKQAELLLANLNNSEPTDVEIFETLAVVCLRTGNSDLLRAAFENTTKSLKGSDIDRREYKENMIAMRDLMIRHFTKRAEYKEAIEQHIKIIEIEPENEELTDQAIKYTQRYGGADILIEHYKILAAEAFKNYRWELVLARIYQAKGDLDKALVHYESAIVDQPEMAELYLAVTEIYILKNDHERALENIDESLRASGGDMSIRKKKIDILLALNRSEDAKTERELLSNKAQDIQLSNADLTEVSYEQIFNDLKLDPLGAKISIEFLVGYVNESRKIERLDRIASELWQLRTKYLEATKSKSSIDLTAADKRRSIVENALVKSIANIASDRADRHELANIHKLLSDAIDEDGSDAQRENTWTFIDEFAHSAGLGDLKEKILIKRAEDSSIYKTENNDKLVDFYLERHAYEKALTFSENTRKFERTADIARALNNTVKELDNLRKAYFNDDNKSPISDRSAERYFELLLKNDRESLIEITNLSSPGHVKLIKFLTAKGEKILAHRAVEGSNLSKTIKLARNAEIALELNEIDETGKKYFQQALMHLNIGEMLKNRNTELPTGDDLAHLQMVYGKWLYKNNDAENADKFIIAKLENTPDNIAANQELVEFYVKNGMYDKALVEISFVSDRKVLTDRLSIYKIIALKQMGKTQESKELFENISKPKSMSDLGLFVNDFAEVGHSNDAAEYVLQILPSKLSNDDSGFADLVDLLNFLSDNWPEAIKKRDYFYNLVTDKDFDKANGEVFIDENLADNEIKQAALNGLIERSINISDESNHYFSTIYAGLSDRSQADLVFDHENAYDRPEPENLEYRYRKEYIKTLINARLYNDALTEINEIKLKIKGKFPLPEPVAIYEFLTLSKLGRFDHKNAESFIGITTPIEARSIIFPNNKRLNKVVEILELNEAFAESFKLQERFYAKNIGLGQFLPSNLNGFLTGLCKQDKNEEISEAVKLIAAMADENEYFIAVGKLENLAQIKQTIKDRKLVSELSEESSDGVSIMKAAAEALNKCGMKAEELLIREAIYNSYPADTYNKIDLAQITRDEKATELLKEIILDKATDRRLRWQAISQLKTEEKPHFQYDDRFDALSQFYLGLWSDELEISEQYFINSLIAQPADIYVKAILLKNNLDQNKVYSAIKIARSLDWNISKDLFDQLSLAAAKAGDTDILRELETRRDKIDQTLVEEIKDPITNSNHLVDSSKHNYNEN